MEQLNALEILSILSFVAGFFILFYKLKVWHEESELRKEMLEYYKNQNHKKEK